MSLQTVLMSILGAMAFAVLFRTAKRYFLLTTALGAISAMGMTLRPTGMNVGVWTFFIALLIAVLSHAFARWKSTPSQSFLIPGVIVLVPGSYIYRAFGFALEDKMQSALRLSLEAVTIACAISFALLLANWVVPPKRSL